ncbi:MAG TPA: DUF805 domain-containing protein [Alphaproteobacteria bacterium]
MGFIEAVEACFRRYFQFSGRSRRAEYWYWTLFILLCSLAFAALDYSLFATYQWGPVYSLFTLATIVPGVAVAVRRLHDIGRSGWWLLLMFAPLLGAIATGVAAVSLRAPEMWPLMTALGVAQLVGIVILVVWALRRGEPAPNRFGPDPLTA